MRGENGKQATSMGIFCKQVAVPLRQFPCDFCNTAYLSRNAVGFWLVLVTRSAIGFLAVVSTRGHMVL